MDARAETGGTGAPAGVPGVKGLGAVVPVPVAAALGLEAPPVELPGEWYNLLHDLPFSLPKDLPPIDPPPDGGGGISSQIPLELVRQTTGRRRLIEIPEPVLREYARWRPTPLRRARALEQAIGTPARIYYKYEGANVSGSHKMNTSIAQAHYYAEAGIDHLLTGTGAGQWGTALAVAARTFDLKCTVFMVELSYRQKPYRRLIMEMFGARVLPSPSDETPSGKAFRARAGGAGGNMALAMAEALDLGAEQGGRFCTGSGEEYSILHQTVIGLEAKRQLAALGESADTVIACVGAGSNFGGTAFPFLADVLAGTSEVRCVAVEPSSCPKLTRGTYAYDFTDYSGRTPLEKMYTLGHAFVTPDIHAGGLRYHGTAKVVSALYHHGLIEAVAYPQVAVFASGVLFCTTEGILPAPESAHAIHAAIVEAERAREEGTSPVILVCVSGHGYFDMSSYETFLAGRLDDPELTEEELQRSLASLPPPFG